MLVVYLPYVKFKLDRFNSNQFKVNSVTVFKDEDPLWKQIIKINRPNFLNIYRAFPEYKLSTIGEPCKGTVIVSDDSEWLSEHYESLLAILYFVGDRAYDNHTGMFHGGVPRELFSSFLFYATGDLSKPIRFLIKDGSFLIDDDESLKTTPPLCLRRFINSDGSVKEYDCTINNHYFQKLFDLLFHDPYHPVIIACRYYFSSNANNMFYNNHSQSYVDLCASIESALGIKNSNDIGKVFSKRICETYLSKISSADPIIRSSHQKMKQMVMDFAYGFYGFRSVYVHGKSNLVQSVPQNDQYRLETYTKFKNLKGRYSYVRALARDIILRVLRENDSPFFDHDSIVDKIDSAMYSKEYWTTILKLAKPNDAASSIVSLYQVEPALFKDIILNFRNKFSWNFVCPTPAKNRIESVIKSFYNAFMLCNYDTSRNTFIDHCDSYICDTILRCDHDFVRLCTELCNLAQCGAFPWKNRRTNPTLPEILIMVLEQLSFGLLLFS